MSVLIKALGLIFISACLLVFLKNRTSEFSFLITVCAVFSVALYVLLFSADSVQKLKDIMDLNSGGGKYITVAVKALIIAYLAETVADTCRDFGQSALAAKAELAGKCVIFVLTVPLFANVVEVVLKFINL